jgi:hypothetical protein
MGTFLCRDPVRNQSLLLVISAIPNPEAGQRVWPRAGIHGSAHKVDEHHARSGGKEIIHG